MLFNPKNSNGEHAAHSAWHRLASGFTSATDFDWKEFDKPPNERKIVTLEHLREVIEGGKELELKEAAHALATIADINERSAYNALAPDGRFSQHLHRTGRVLSFRQ